MGNIEKIVFFSLVLDLFAFTIPLPLFPRIIQWYTVRETVDPNGFLSQTLNFVSHIRSLLYKSGAQSKRWDVVLLGGLMGSAFSTLQWLVSPAIGSLSDKYGRKKILLLTMIGNILSAVVWVQSTTFASYLLSRVIGGLSEGNVQLAIAILSDVTTPANRSKALAHVGIAFAICFIIGPPIGAYFAQRPVPESWLKEWGVSEVNVYAVPAFITLVLLVAETAFLAVALPETRGKGFVDIDIDDIGSEKKDPSTTKLTKAQSVTHRLSILARLRSLHFLFLGIFSGVEFTLTFLTFDLFDWNNKQNGYLIGSIGIISALLQGGYVRRSIAKVGEGKMAQRGVWACAAGLCFLTFLPHFVGTDKVTGSAATSTMALRLLQGAAACFAFTSATVVNSLTSFASLQCDEGLEGHPQLAKGKALGRFRSSGQLGRAMGPLLACASYWTFGPSATYAVSATAMITLAVSMNKIAGTRSQL